MSNFTPRAQQVLCGGGVASRRRSLQMVHKTTTATRFGDGANRTIKVQVPALTCHISHYFPTSGRRPGMPYKPVILQPHVMLSYEVLNIAEICSVLKVSSKTVYRLVARKKLRRVPAIRHVRVTRKALDEFLAGEVN